MQVKEKFMVWTGEFDKLFIGGDWVAPNSTNRIEVISPYTEAIVASVPAASNADVDAAVASARNAFDHGPWPRLPLGDRVAVLERLSDLLGQNRDTIAELVTAEMGCPISLSTSIQATTPKLILDAQIEVAAGYPWTTVKRSSTGNALVTKKPIGVVAAVVPWNAPLATTMHKLGAALLSGCTIILKPAPETPLNAYLLADLVKSAGVPEGVVSVVPAGRDVSEYLVTHPGVDKVAFTGSTAAGRRIAGLCGEDLKRVTLELGGKSAAVILDDADLDVAVETLRLGSFRNSGQICSNKTRIVVSKFREIELLDRLAEMVETMPVGDPMDSATQIGPLVSSRQRQNVENYLGIGRAEGAKTIVGGGRPPSQDRGWFVEPTVFGGVTPEMRIAQEEIFGPVIAVLTFEREDEAVAIANDSNYGLNGAVFTSDVEHGLAVAGRIDTGTVEINGSPAGFTSPMGGVKQSGIGREGGDDGFAAYVESRSIGIPAAYAETLP